MLENDFYLFDTPGMLWPKITVPQAGFNLAASGAVGRNAFVEEEVAVELLAYLRLHYAPLLVERYKLEITPELSDEELLEQLGRKRAAMLSGGRVNLQKAAEILMYEFRQGTLGRITLETPEEFSAWDAAAEIAEAEAKAAAVAKKAARKQGRKR